MTLDQYIERCQKAIRANFKVRNSGVFGTTSRQLHLRKSRGDQIRRWILELREALNPATSQAVSARVRWLVN